MYVPEGLEFSEFFSNLTLVRGKFDVHITTCIIATTTPACLLAGEWNCATEEENTKEVGQHELELQSTIHFGIYNQTLSCPDSLCAYAVVGRWELC